ncbi:major facilitator transporter [Hysterangium stoloniferum]|nr:major facilitator transporter [Hysterangium stoloniferum]
MVSADDYGRKAGSPLCRQNSIGEVEGLWQDPENVHQDKPTLTVRRTPLPRLQLGVLLYMQLAEPITAHLMLPFIVQLIVDTGVTEGDITKVGYYTGLVESLFFMAEALTILQWGRLSDRVGRRPVLLLGLFGLGLSMLCFGLSHTFVAVVASRSIAGALNGNTGVIKCMMGEITDDTNVADGFSMIPLTWALGNIVAPLIGGLLEHPYERLGGFFHLSEFWRVNPYFLPCAVSAIFSASAFLLGFFFLNETAPSKTLSVEVECREVSRSAGMNTRISVLEPTSSLTESSPLIPQRKPATSLYTLLTPRVLVVIINYSLLAIVDISFYVLQPLFLSTPIIHGGLGMSPSIIGTCIAGFGIGNGLITAFFFAPLIKRVGAQRLATISLASYFGTFALFPIMNMLARHHGGLSSSVWLAFMMQLGLATFSPIAYGVIFIYVTSSAPSRSALGATNGLAQTTTSIMRCIGPICATSLFALSVEKNILKGNLVYLILWLLTFAATSATLLLPKKPLERAKN